MNNKSKTLLGICADAVALTLVVVLSMLHIGQEPAPPSVVRPVGDFTREDRVTPPEPKPTHVDEETATVEPANAPPLEIDFELPEPRGGTAIPTSKEAPMDNPIPSTTPPHTATTVTAAEPQMGDSCTADGQNRMCPQGEAKIDFYPPT